MITGMEFAAAVARGQFDIPHAEAGRHGCARHDDVDHRP
jgi:hypothetical protein